MESNVSIKMKAFSPWTLWLRSGMSQWASRIRSHLFVESTTLGRGTSSQCNPVYQSWWHQSWPNWGGMSSYVSKVKSNSNLIPGVNLLNKDWWITRLGKSWPEKGEENCKWRGGDHLAWFNKNEDVPQLRIQESGFRRARRSICWRQWGWTLVDFSHKRNTLMPTSRPPVLLKCGNACCHLTLHVPFSWETFISW